MSDKKKVTVLTSGDCPVEAIKNLVSMDFRLS